MPSRMLSKWALGRGGVTQVMPFWTRFRVVGSRSPKPARDRRVGLVNGRKIRWVCSDMIPIPDARIGAFIFCINSIPQVYFLRDLRNLFVLTPERIIGTMPERRSPPCRKTVLPVRVSVGEATQLAHTVDMTYTGARLGGLRTALHPGYLVG